MASEHSITIQVAPASASPFSPGHVAIVINTPAESTYAGFGPNPADSYYSRGAYSASGQFDVQKISRDVSPKIATSTEKNFSTVLDHNHYSTFTIAVSKKQVDAALAEIAKLGVTHGSYVMPLNVCSTTVNRILEAANLPKVAVDPTTAWLALDQYNEDFLKDPKSAAHSPWIDFRWRDLQKDYAYTGRGYDTPSEFRGGVWSRGRAEVDHVPLGPPSQIGEGNGIGDWWRNIAEDPKKMNLTANEPFQPLNAADQVADSAQRVATGIQLFQGPNGQPVADMTGWQNGMFDAPSAPVPQAPRRLVSSQQQSNFDSYAVDRQPVDYGAAAGATPVSPEDMSELLKLRSIIQAVGSRGLFPIQ